MTAEYIVLGVVLIIMGLVQAWLRHGPGAKRLREEEATVAARRAAAARAEMVDARDDADEIDDSATSEQRPDAAARADQRGKKVWSTWTAMLGGVSIAMGILLVVLGVLGR